MSATSMEWKHHYHTLTEQETEEVIQGVADLIVNFLKGIQVVAAGRAGR